MKNNLLKLITTKVATTVLLCLVLSTATYAQTSAFQVTSTSGGFVAPSMTSTQRGAISTPATGSLVYQTDAPAGYYYYDGTQWLQVVAGSSSAVSSFSGGTTGLTPSSATTGSITLNGTLNVSNGGTGQSSYTDGQLLIGNSTNNTLSKSTLTAGTGITITNGGGSISIANTNTPNTGSGTANYNTYWTGTNALGSEQYTATSRGGLGANLTAGAIGAIPYASSTTAYSTLPAVAAGSYLRSAGTGTAPVWSTLTLPNSAEQGNLLSATASNTISATSTPTLGLAGTTKGTLGFSGSTSGTVTIQPQAAAGTYNFNLPTTAGTSGQFLISGGGSAAPMTWSTLTQSGTTVYQTASVTPTTTTYSILTGLTTTFTADANHLYFISTHGCIVDPASSTGKSVNSVIGIYVDGVALTNGGFQTTSAQNLSTTSIWTYGPWSITGIVSLSAGSHTIDVRGNRLASSNVDNPQIGGGTGTGCQGALTVLTLTK